MSASTGLPAHPPATAGFGVRTLAYLVDALLLSFVGGAFPYLLINTATTAPSGNPGQQVTTSGGGSLLVSLIYFVLFWSSFGGGRTLGMRLFGLKVVREEDLGQMGVLSAFVRWIGLWLSFALCFIGVIWVAFDSRHQGWHDKIARTLVLHQ
ncbi:MAG: RDD family protein [Chloroflexi bacterium]|nr:MAG: RDD family protein [Chloroflexota bacterium]TMF31011.1 MAG: RDD family protein [Chloroflexota bacterium]